MGLGSVSEGIVSNAKRKIRRESRFRYISTRVRFDFNARTVIAIAIARW